MDFLRRLVPQRETDATRAVAVLPSRFASESPLLATIGQAPPAQRPEDDHASLLLDTASPPASNTLVALRHSVTDVQPSQQAAPHPLGSLGPTHRDGGKASSPIRTPSEVPDSEVANPHASRNLQGPTLERARPLGLELQGSAELPAAVLGLQGAAAPPLQRRVASPLSQAILAQRTLQPRDDNQVVHVTIGRIDVVASAAPAPAVRREPTPRQGTVALADYLRGGDGRRR